jgi:hypothetical protein
LLTLPHYYLVGGEKLNLNLTAKALSQGGFSIVYT